MTVHNSYPTKILLNYSSAFAPHIMTLPAPVWSPISLGHDAGTLLDWNGGQRDVVDMMDDFTDALQDLFQASVNIESYSVWTRATPSDPWVFKVAIALSKTGTNASVQANKAIQTTYNMIDTAGFPVKLVLLDAPVIDYDRSVGVSALTADEATLISVFQDSGNAFASRAINQMSIYRTRTTTLNEKLRREYRMT